MKRRREERGPRTFNLFSERFALARAPRQLARH
jgi:hypothetical protein